MTLGNGQCWFIGFFKSLISHAFILKLVLIIVNIISELFNLLSNKGGDNVNIAIAIIRYFNYLDCPDEEIVITDYWHQFLLLFTEILAIIIIITTI